MQDKPKMISFKNLSISIDYRSDESIWSINHWIVYLIIDRKKKGDFYLIHWSSIYQHFLFPKIDR
jgi:hypothetical protein